MPTLATTSPSTTIPLPTTTHLEWVSKAAAQGKHILCEKPVGCSTAELVEMLRIAKEANMVYISNRCIKQDYQLIFEKRHPVFPVLKN